MEKKYMMNVSAIKANDPKKYEFLMKDAEVPFFGGNNVPVVDITTGRIYGSLLLDNYSSDFPCHATLRNHVIESITNGIAFKPAKDSKDYYGEDVTGHLFMDVGSVGLSTLKAIWKNYQKSEEVKKKEADKIKRAEQVLREIKSLQDKVDSLIEEAKELLKD